MKIYYGPRYIELTSPTTDTTRYAATHSYTDANALRAFVEGFANDESQECACITYDDVTELRHEFFKLYRIIEAAGGLIHNGNDEYLIIDRKGVPDLPKGKAEGNETAVQNALREVEEETGLKGMNIIDHIADTYHTYAIGDETVLKHTTWFSMSVPGRPGLTPESEENITDARWVPRKMIAKEAEQTYASLRDVFRTVVS